MSAYVDLYAALWTAAYGPDRYAKRKDSPGQMRLFGPEHDVKDEPRDDRGRWTAGGNSPKDSPAPADQPPKKATVKTEAGNGSAGTEPKAEGGAMELSQRMIDEAKGMHAQWPGQQWDKIASTIESMSDDERAKVEAYLAGGSFKNRSKKLGQRIKDGKTPVVPMDEAEQAAAQQVRQDTEAAQRAEQAKIAEQTAESARQREQSRKADLANNPLQQRAAGEVGWRTDKRGRRIYVTGTRYGDPNVEKLRAIGATWDPQEKAWWIGSGKAADLERLVSDVNGRKQAGQAEAVRRQSEGLAISIPYEHSDIREQAKKAGARWDGVRKQWLMPNAESHAKIKAAIEDKYRKQQADRDRKEAADRATKMPAGGRMFTKTTDIRSGGYAVGSRIRDKDGKLWVITAIETPQRFEDGLSFGMGRDDGYEHTAYARPATEQEDAESRKAIRIAELEKQVRILGVGPDDERDRESHDKAMREALDELKSLRNK